ncbi:MAG: porin, partial [Cruoricaptor ignavus]|nr:porin [Cruoricaptor ignavus]
KLYLGATYHYNQKAKRTSGQLGSLLYDEKNMSSFLADAMLKYNGWSFMTSYMNRKTPDETAISINNTNPAEYNYVYTGNGYDTQLSYVFPKNWEVIGRFSALRPQNEIYRYTPRQNQYSIGLTKYIWEHAFKAQFEVSKNDFKYFDGSKKDSWYVRLQIEMGI